MGRARRISRFDWGGRRVDHPVQIQLRELFIVMIVVAVAAASVSRWSSRLPESQQFRFLSLILGWSAAAGLVLVVGLLRRQHALRKAGDFEVLIPAQLRSQSRRWLLVTIWACAAMGAVLLVILALLFSIPDRQLEITDLFFCLLVLVFALGYVYFAAWRLPWYLVCVEIHEQGLIIGPWHLVLFENVRDHCRAVGQIEGIELLMRDETRVIVPLPPDQREVFERFLNRKLKDS